MQPNDFLLISLADTEILNALETGMVDAAVLWHPWAAHFRSAAYRSLACEDKSVDYTLCGIFAKRSDYVSRRSEVSSAVRRYLYCARQIVTGKVDAAQIIAEQFNVSIPVSKTSLERFSYVDEVEECIGLAARESAISYMESELQFLSGQGLSARGLVIRDRVCLLEKDELASDISDLTRQIPVALHSSVSCAPFFVGRFLNLFS
jgi:hypothetical protein